MKTQVHAANEVSLSSLRRQLEVSRGGHAREGDREVYAYRSIDRRGARGRRTAGNCLPLPRSRSNLLSSPSLSITRRLDTPNQPTLLRSLDLCGPLWRSPAPSERQLARHNTKSSPLLYRPKPIISLPSKSKAHHLSTVQILLPPCRLLCSSSSIRSYRSRCLARVATLPPSIPPSLPISRSSCRDPLPSARGM